MAGPFIILRIIMDAFRDLSDALDGWQQSLSSVLSSPSEELVREHALKIEAMQTVCDLLYAELCEMEQHLPEKKIECETIRESAKRLCDEGPSPYF